MKNFLLKIILLYLILSTQKSFAWWILGHEWALWSWYVSFDDIPNIIWHAINYFMWAAWMISVIFIIIWAYQIMFGSISQNNSQWKNTIIAAIFGFIIAALAWVIIKLILNNFT